MKFPDDLYGWVRMFVAGAAGFMAGGFILNVMDNLVKGGPQG